MFLASEQKVMRGSGGWAGVGWGGNGTEEHRMNERIAQVRGETKKLLVFLMVAGQDRLEK